MSGRQPSWADIAHHLAERVEHQVGQCPHDEIHPGCGFCSDRVAYEAYRAKCRAAGVAHVPTFDETLGYHEVVPISEVGARLAADDPEAAT